MLYLKRLDMRSVAITVRCIHNYYVTLIFITKESIERKIGKYVLCILNQTAK